MVLRVVWFGGGGRLCHLVWHVSGEPAVVLPSEPLFGRKHGGRGVTRCGGQECAGAVCGGRPLLFTLSAAVSECDCGRIRGDRGTRSGREFRARGRGTADRAGSRGGVSARVRGTARFFST